MLPNVVAHADWGSQPNKRQLAVAVLRGHRYEVSVPSGVGNTAQLIPGLEALAGSSTLLVGFDFPIGLPSAYLQAVGIDRFMDLLPELGSGKWSQFYDVASDKNEISLHRPFYPYFPAKGVSVQHLLDALGVDSIDRLLRQCERARPERLAASSIFWLVGPKQVGKAALRGWKEVLAPVRRRSDNRAAFWPHDGEFATLLASSPVTIVETYPAEACVQLGLGPPGVAWAKTSQKGRAGRWPLVEKWARQRSVDFSDRLTAALQDGFGSTADGEDPFDAVIGLLGMLDVVLGHTEPGAPDIPEIRNLEGWILGQRG